MSGTVTHALFGVAALAGGLLPFALSTHPTLAGLLAAVAVGSVAMFAAPYAAVRAYVAAGRRSRRLPRRVCVPGTGVCVRIERRSVTR